MNPTERPPQPPLTGDRHPDELEPLLRAFFRAEMPDPWPKARRPAAAPPPVLRGNWFLNSRFVLAASALILLGLCVASAQTFRAGFVPYSPDQGNPNISFKSEAYHGHRVPTGKDAKEVQKHRPADERR